jgi:hypothetical protein
MLFEIMQNTRTLMMLCRPLKLIDVIGDLSRDYRVVVAPLGVKPFALISMLAVLRFQNADVWRVSGSTRSTPVDRKPIGENLLFEVIFVED